MTILTAFQSAAIRLIGSKPASFFSSSDTFQMEMQVVANEVARDIAKSHDWQAMVSTYTLTGDGTTTDFPLPPDYDRMLADTEIYDQTNWAWGYNHILSENEWLYLKIRNWAWITPGAWIIYGGQFHFQPAPTTGALAEFMYIGKNIIQSAAGDPKAEFTTDTDVFVLDERLLMLGMVWKWRELKQLDATAAEADFRKAFDEIAGKDGGPKIIRSRPRWRPLRGRFAYPWGLGGY